MDNTIHPVEKESTITLLSKNNDSITLKSKYHVSRIKKNLFSVANAMDASYYILFGPKDVKFLHNIKDVKANVIHTRRGLTICLSF